MAERGLSPFDIIVDTRDNQVYVVKDEHRYNGEKRVFWVLIKEKWAQRLDFCTITPFSWVEIKEHFKFRWEIQNGK